MKEKQKKQKRKSKSEEPNPNHKKDFLDLIKKASSPTINQKDKTKE